mgnify:CR=1 FL=1
MLGNPSIPRYLSSLITIMFAVIWMMETIGNNASGADDQQERPGIADWIAGFVDGEGTFSVSIFRNRTMSQGWQVFPEFVVTQGIRGLDALKTIRGHFGCGKIYINRRKDNHREDVAKYCVRSLKDLSEVIIPFFEEHRLVTAKKRDFAKFARIVALMRDGRHHEPEGLMIIASIAESMNRRKKSEFLESSETIRQALSAGKQSIWMPSSKERAMALSEEIVRPPWRHGEPGRNDLATNRVVGSNKEPKVTFVAPAIGDDGGAAGYMLGHPSIPRY